MNNRKRKTQESDPGEWLFTACLVTFVAGVFIGLAYSWPW